jgi:hypothetical protein
MNGRQSGAMADAVAAYCKAMVVPDLDEAAIIAASRLRVRAAAPRRIRLTAASGVALVGLVVLVCNGAAVVAGVQRAFAAFSVAAGRAQPMTIRAVDLERARADMPFTVIAPPSIAGAGVVAVDEIDADSAASNASVVFELRGTAPRPGIMIIESDAARYHGRTIFAIPGPAASARSLQARWPQSPVPADDSKPNVVLRGSFQGRAFAPPTWVAHGTRIVVMSPPGVLSTAQLQTIRHQMSR